jgi:LL-diaminopimelate aminotransferase
MRIKKLIIDKADRLYQIPPEVRAHLSDERRNALLRRQDLIDLASLTWPAHLDSAWAPSPANIRPASAELIENLKEELLSWLAANQQVRLASTKEIFIGGRISSLLYNLALAYIDTGDVAFVPDLGVPQYRRVVVACGGEAVGYGISHKHNWTPRFDRIAGGLGRVARVLFLNSPHNPTGTELSDSELADLVRQAAKENILIINDAAYQAIPTRRPVSLLSVEGGRKVGVEVYSFSYQFGLPWLPFGFVAGNHEVIAGLKTAATLNPAYIPEYYVDLAFRAIRKYPSEGLRAVRSLCTKTAAEADKLLEMLSLENVGTSTIPFLWARVQRRRNAGVLARLLYRRYRLLIAPGNSFGENGQGFLRFSLTAGPKAYEEACARIRSHPGLMRAKGTE